MIVDKAILIILAAIAVALFILGVVIKTSNSNAEKKAAKNGIKFTKVTTDDIINKLNASDAIKDFGSRFENSKELTVLFRKSKNPWNLTHFTYNAIRFGGLAVCIVLALIAYFVVGIEIMILFLIFGFLCFYIPQKKYKDAAADRERQWNQLYQFIWVIKHNATFYDPKKVWLETEAYISSHTKNLPELENGFHDFAEHWNGSYMDDYIHNNYGDFEIPKELFNIMLVSQQTGEYPENELNSLRTIIINKMNFTVQDVLSTVGAKATMSSAPFLLASVALVVIVPVVLQIMEAFS